MCQAAWKLLNQNRLSFWQYSTVHLFIALFVILEKWLQCIAIIPNDPKLLVHRWLRSIQSGHWEFGNIPDTFVWLGLQLLFSDEDRSQKVMFISNECPLHFLTLSCISVLAQSVNHDFWSAQIFYLCLSSFQMWLVLWKPARNEIWLDRDPMLYWYNLFKFP